MCNFQNSIQNIIFKYNMLINVNKLNKNYRFKFKNKIVKISLWQRFSFYVA